MADSKAAAEAVNILRNLLSSPILINTIANSVDSSSSGSHIDAEIGQLFRPTRSNVESTTNQTQNLAVTLPSTSGAENQTPRYIARRYSSWRPNSKGKRYVTFLCFLVLYGIFNLILAGLLLYNPSCSPNTNVKLLLV